jgi:class 3 adenylate cyclase
MDVRSERRLVSCLFIDVVGSTDATVRLGPENLGPSLARLDLFSEGGSRLAGAVAAAIREEEAAAKGGPSPAHDQLKALGCAGLSELLRFRPTLPASA